MLDHCNEDECCLDPGGDDWVCMAGVFCEACLLLLSAAEDDDGPETLGVEGAVTVGPTGFVDNLPVLDE